MDGPLWAALDEPVPERPWCGTGTSWYVSGWCFHEEQPVDDLEIVVGEHATPVLGRAGRRPDVRAALPDVAIDDRGPLAFWALVDLVPDDESPRTVALRAHLADGSIVETDFGRTTPVRDDRLSLDLDSDARVAVAMATYEPPEALFAAQIASLQAQTLTDWVCVVCDDGSSPTALDRIIAAIVGDPRFVLVRNRENVGHYRNFERALRLLPRGPELVSFADQDDIWYPEKLASTVAALERDDALLVATNCRLVEPDGRVRSELYDDITANVDDLRAALITSTLAGASMLFRRSLLELALPFPPTTGGSVHDHWIAIAAVASGAVTVMPQPTYDWVQHADNTLGWMEKRTRFLSVVNRMRSLPREVFGGAGACFEFTIPVAQRARTLALRGAVGGDTARGRLLEALGGPGAGARRERVRLAALNTSGNDAKVLRGGDLAARRGAVWMASHAVRRRLGIGLRWHRRVAPSSLPRSAQAADAADLQVSVQIDVRAVFAADGPPTVAVAAPERRPPPVSGAIATHEERR